MEYTLVTGACGGLGGAFVARLAAEGAPLFLTGRSGGRLEELAARLKEQYPALPVEVCPCDLTDSASRQALFAHADARGMRFCRLVYVAGVDTQMAAELFTEEKIVMQARVNLEGAVSLARGVFLRRCGTEGAASEEPASEGAAEGGAAVFAECHGENKKERRCRGDDGGGKHNKKHKKEKNSKKKRRKGDLCELLAVGSMSASTPMPYFALYSATKKALEQYWIALRAEVKGRAKATVVLPGGIPTREDIKADILSHGWFGRVSAKSPQAVARISLKAAARNKRRKIVGFWNKLLYGLERLVPLSLRLSVISKIWSKSKKDAF